MAHIENAFSYFNYGTNKIHEHNIIKIILNMNPFQKYCKCTNYAMKTSEKKVVHTCLHLKCL